MTFFKKSIFVFPVAQNIKSYMVVVHKTYIKRMNGVSRGLGFHWG